MPISFASAQGNLFNVLGKVALLLKQMGAYQDAQLVNMTDTTAGVTAQLNAEPDIQAIMGDNYIPLLDSGAASLLGVARQIAAGAVNRFVFRDNPRPGQTLVRGNTLESLREVIRQMKVQGASVRAHTVSGTASAFTGSGNGVAMVSLRRPIDGLLLENAFAETLTVTCTSDSITGPRAEGNESFALTGAGRQTNLLAFNWPLGSDARASLSAIDGSADNSAGNLLANSGFDAFTSNTPDDFTVVTGTAGTDFFSEATLVLGPSGSALRLAGTASAVLTQLKQRFGNGGGRVDSLDPVTQYGFCLWLRRDGTAAASGTLTVDLVDANDAVLQDEAGNANTLSIDLTALTTQYAAYTAAFRTPYDLPADIYLRLRLTAALTSGRSVYLDRMALGEMTQAYSSGPYAAIFSGGAAFQEEDYASLTISNGRGAGGTLDTFQTALSRLFPSEVYDNEILFPSSATPTISDTLIG